MADASTLSQADLEILVVRELRKAGIELAGVHVRRRTPLAEREGRYELLLEARLGTAEHQRVVLIECHNRKAPVDAAVVDRFAATIRDAKLNEGILIATSGYAVDAVKAARTLGIPLLAVADGATAWRTSGWATGPAPSWFPEFVAQSVDLSELGEPRAETLRAGAARVILDRLRPLPPPDAPTETGTLPPPA